MAYIALYRKWRPKSFEDVVGQSHITKTLQKAIDTDKVAHAYLFSGPRGTGKTSTAKIFARAMNCVHGPTSHPCNECEVCRHIMSGESLDVVEIDAASNRSIEDIRTLRETIKFMPAEGHKKIYIIDEVHMLTTEAFNALLKTLEEPPSHVIFILATTEPERIPMTILSRCQRYEFRRITSRDIAERILYIAGQEHIDITKGAAHILAVQADGGMRDALSMLDQCVSNASGTIDEALVRNLLGLIGKDWLFSMTEAIFNGKGDVIIKGVDDIIRMGKEPIVILTEVLEHLRAIMLYQAAPKSDTLSAYDDCMKELAAQAKAVTAEKVFAILQCIQQALLSAKTSPAPRVAVEMGLLMASRTTAEAAAPAGGNTAVVTETVPDAVLDRLTRLEQAVQELRMAPPTPVSYAAVQPEPMPTPAAPVAVAPVEPVVTAPRAIPVQPACPTPTVAPTPGPAASAVPPAPPATGTTKTTAKPVVSAQYQQIWKAACDILNKEKKPAIYSCVRFARVAYIGEGKVIIAFKSPFMVKRSNREDYFSFVDGALGRVLGGTYHMQAFQEGDAELLDYEQGKSSQTTAPVVPEPAAAPPVAPPPVTVPAPKETVPRDLEPKEPVPPQPQPPPTAPETAVAPAPTQPPVEVQPQEATLLQPATVADMSDDERTALEPLLKMVGDCNIYVEHK